MCANSKQILTGFECKAFKTDYLWIKVKYFLHKKSCTQLKTVLNGYLGPKCVGTEMTYKLQQQHAPVIKQQQYVSQNVI